LFILIGAFAQAQTIHYDANLSQYYMNIDPIQVTWFTPTVYADRLYIKMTSFGPAPSLGWGYINFNWWIRYPFVVDSSTTVYKDYISGSAGKTLRMNTRIDSDMYGIFYYVQDTVTVDNKELNIILTN
jgi:hypothetical protein